MLSRANPIGYIHGMLGVLVAAVTWYVFTRIKNESLNATPLVQYGNRMMLLLVFIQVAIGGILIGAGLPELMRLYHLWVASLFIGTLLLLFSALKRREV